MGKDLTYNHNPYYTRNGTRDNLPHSVKFIKVQSTAKSYQIPEEHTWLREEFRYPRKVEDPDKPLHSIYASTGFDTRDEFNMHLFLIDTGQSPRGTKVIECVVGELCAPSIPLPRRVIDEAVREYAELPYAAIAGQWQGRPYVLTVNCDL